jgi:uncharacterized protein YkwD
MSSTLAILCASVALSATPAAENTATGPAPAAAIASAAIAPAASAPAASDAAAPAAEKPKKSAASIDLHPAEEGVIERTNSERVRYGLRPFIIDRLLMLQARRHAAWMTKARTLQHTSAGVAENIAMGQRSSSEAVQTWMNSSGHRANILNASYTRIGVAAYTTPEGTIYWCQQFLR